MGLGLTSQILHAAGDPPGVDEITESLARAFDRIADFQAVQSQAASDELLAAVERLQQSVGIVAEPRALIAERLGGSGSSRASGHVLLGLIIGLMAAELADEPSSSSTTSTG